MIIKNGSEKQVNWANEIFAKWIKCIDDEVSAIKARLDDGGASDVLANKLQNKIEKINSAKEKAIHVFAQKNAADVIEFHKSGRDLAKLIIASAQA